MNRIKPDSEVFGFVTSEFGRSPNEIVFVDDSQRVLDAAQAYGWDTQFTIGYPKLIRVLRKMGVTQ